LYPIVIKLCMVGVIHNVIKCVKFGVLIGWLMWAL
jgi:hypothetical protein